MSLNHLLILYKVELKWSKNSLFAVFGVDAGFFLEACNASLEDAQHFEYLIKSLINTAKPPVHPGLHRV